jgi:hypothetical protein
MGTYSRVLAVAASSSCARSVVGAQVVHDDDVSWAQHRHQVLAYEGEEDSARGAARLCHEREDSL